MLNQPRPGFVTVEEYLKLPSEGDWLLEPLIPVSGACLIYGSPKTGKSYLGIQMGNAIAAGQKEFLDFPIVKTGKVLYMQLDTPRSLWTLRFNKMIAAGIKFSPNLKLADKESVEYQPFDFMQPLHIQYIKSIVAAEDPAPVAVVVDTLRESHSGDSDSDTSMRNVITNMVSAVHPAALILVSHSRKAMADVDKDIMDDHRGSSYVPGRMDAIIRLTKTRLYYAGRAIEEGNIKLDRQESGLWLPSDDPNEMAALNKVLTDSNLPSLGTKARALAQLLGKNEEAMKSRVRRAMSKPMPFIIDKGDKINTETGEVIDGGS